MQKTEHRVTLTVTFIVTMFTLTNGPSALVHLVMYATHEELYDLTMISSTLVICGKASNFILFCLGSKHFRLRLLKLVTSSEELCRFFFFLVLHTRSSYLFKTAKCETSSFSRLGSS
uniref:G-protein coupled receptors family 1 profile domain-containing protein n=1 Tax=Caenorhabditis japonica TaxID=281687 RepID=A0A8R1IN46_CAEJA